MAAIDFNDTNKWIGKITETVEPRAKGHAAFAIHEMTAILPKNNLGIFGNGLAFNDPATRAVHWSYIFMRAIIDNDDRALSQMMQLNKQIHAHVATTEGITPLMAASARGCGKAQKFLIDQPLTDLNAQTADGWTALHYASYFGQADMVRALLTRKADATVKNSASKMPRDVAASDEIRAIFEEFDKKRPARKPPSLHKAPATMHDRPQPANAMLESLQASAHNMNKDGWHGALLAAASAGNLDAVLYCADSLGKKLTKSMLNEALWKSLLDGDHRDVVSELLFRGADADNKRILGKAWKYAVNDGRADSFAEMALWGGKLGGKEDMNILYRRCEAELSGADQEKMLHALRQYFERRKFEKKEKSAARVFNDVGFNSSNILPAYASGRDRSELDDFKIGRMIAWKHKHPSFYGFLRRLTKDGFKPAFSIDDAEFIQKTSTAEEVEALKRRVPALAAPKPHAFYEDMPG